MCRWKVRNTSPTLSHFRLLSAMIVINSSIRCNNTSSTPLFTSNHAEKQSTSQPSVGMGPWKNFIRHRQQGSPKLTSKEVAKHHEASAWWIHKQSPVLWRFFSADLKEKSKSKVFTAQKVHSTRFDFVFSKITKQIVFTTRPFGLPRNQLLLVTEDGLRQFAFAY